MPSQTSTDRLKYIKWVGALLLCLIASVHLGRTAVQGGEAKAIVIAVMFLAIAVLFKLGLNKDPKAMGRKYLPWLTIPVILLAIWAANIRLFGQFDVSAVIFHIQHGLDYDGVGDDIAEFILFLITAAILILTVSYLARRDQRIKWIDRLIALPLLLVNPVSMHLFDRVLITKNGKVPLVEIYEPPVIVSEEKSKNLLLIYLESMEATYDDPVFGDTFSDLLELSEQGLRLNGVDQIQDTGWTIAGMVASQCGIPLLGYGLVMKNRLKNIDSFLPDAKCLGTELSSRGYQTSYLGGADLNFAAKGRFLKTHGYDTTIGMQDIPIEHESQMSEWGIHDDYLFDLALTELKRLNSQDAPYLFSILTLGGHSPAGYPAPSCDELIENSETMDRLLLSISCTAALTQTFIIKAQSEGLLENTTVVILSDHLAMKNTQYDLLTQRDRENFVLIIDLDIQPGEKDITGSMMDLYPTILDAIGLPSTNHSAGLGVSLLSDSDTLLTQYGQNTLDLAIRSDKALRRQLWNIE